MRRSPFLSAMVLGLLVSLSLSSPGQAAESLRLEAEHFTAIHDVGGTFIYSKTCSDASGGLAVEGLDMDGEWIRLRLVLTEDHCFADSLRSAGPLGAVREYEITVASLDGSTWVSDSVTTPPGAGIT